MEIGEEGEPIEVPVPRHPAQVPPVVLPPSPPSPRLSPHQRRTRR